MSKPPIQDGQLFVAPNPLRDRVGPRSREAEVKALARAEAALATLATNFDSWLEDDLTKLYAARDAMLQHGVDDTTINKLFTHVLDIKGLGSTYNFPLVTRFAASLSKLLGDGDNRLHGPMPLVEAHISAIRATVREKVRDGGYGAGVALAEELERHTRACLPDKAS